MLSSSMITIVFRFINFLFFLALFIYGFKHYIYSEFIAQMRERDRVRKDLEQQKENLAIVQERLDTKIHANELAHQQLMATLHIWQHNFEHKQQELREEKERIKYQLELKMERRREIQLLNLMQDEVVLPAITHSNKALHDYFAQKNHGNAYLKEVLAYMESQL